MGMSANGAQYRHPDRALLLDRRGPGDAVPRRRDDAVLLRLEGAQRPRVHVAPVRHQAPTWSTRSAFAVAQLLIAGVNLYLLGAVVRRAARLAAVGRADRRGRRRAVLHPARRPVGGDLQRGAAVLRDRRRADPAHDRRPAPGRRLGRAEGEDHRAAAAGAETGGRSSSTPGRARRSPASTTRSGRSIGIVFGLGFVLSFGYWTTNFVEVQRAMASELDRARPADADHRRRSRRCSSRSSSILPGMIAAVLVPEIVKLKNGEASGGASARSPTTTRILLLMRDLLPNGLLGVAITGLLAAFMAGMAANISAFNTVFSYDLWQRLHRQGPPRRLLPPGRPDRHRRRARVIAIGTALIAAGRTPTSWTTCRRCSGSSTRRCSRRSSSACSGSG